MSNAATLELLLLAKDKMSPALQRLLKLFRQTEKDGKSSTSAIDKLTKKLERAPKTAGLQKTNAEIKKTVLATGAASLAEEKLNAARKRKSGSDGKIKQETADKIKLAGATEKAVAAEEKLNNARKRGVRNNTSPNRRSQTPPVERAPRRRPRRINSIEEDIVTGGAGAGMLWAAKEGMTSAMTKQEAMTDLYNAFYRSSLGAQELNAQMRAGEKIADDLGNKLPGTTADYLQMFATMKQRGIEADSILKGAGKSAAYLAVSNKEDRQEVGSNIARFGQMFNLKTEGEYMGAADLMSRAKTTYGINSSELMEAVKDFSGRTGKGLGLDGQKGAEDTLRFLAFLRAKTGMEGLTVGTSASSFFGQYLQSKQKKEDPTAELKKLTGVDLQIFDKKGKFLGLENAVKEFSKLKGKLSDEQMVGFGNKIAGEEGSAVFQAMVKNGEQFGSFNQEMTTAASMMEVSAKNAENLTNKIEALTGSLSNLGAAGFGPMLGGLSKLTDKTNEWVGKLTEAAKAQPVFAATTSSVLTLGGALLTLKGGSGLLSGLANRFGGVTEAAAASTRQVGGLRKNLTSLPTMLKIGLTVMIAAEAWEQIQKMRKAVDDFKNVNSDLNDVGENSYKAQQQEDEMLRAKNQAPDYKNRAKEALDLIQGGKNQELSKALDPSKMGWYEWYGKTIGSLVSGTAQVPFYRNVPSGKGNSPEEREEYSRLTKQYSQEPVPSMFINAIDRATKEIVGAQAFKSRVPMLGDPNTMTAFRRDSLPTLNLNPDMRQHVEKMLERAFPQSFAQSSQQMMQNSGLLNQSFLNLVQPVSTVADNLLGLNNNSNTATTAVGNLATAVNSAAARINDVQITPPVFAPIRVPIFGQAPASPFSSFGSGAPIGREKGGSVRKGHEYRINEVGQEFFTPAQSGSIISNDILRKGERTLQLLQSVSFPTKGKTDNPNQSLFVRYEKNISINKETKQDSVSSLVNFPRRSESEKMGAGQEALKKDEKFASAKVLQNSQTMGSSAANNFHLTVNMKIDGSKEPADVAAEVKRAIATLVIELREETDPRRVAQKVAYEAERDAERT